MRTALYKDEHQTHVAVDSGCNESAQLIYNLLLGVLAGYRHFSAHGRRFSSTDTNVDDAWSRKLGVDGMLGRFPVLNRN